MSPTSQEILGTVALSLLALLLSIFRSTRTRPIRKGRLWILPTVVIVSALGDLSGKHFANGLEFWPLFGVLFVGGCVGWLRANAANLMMDHDTGIITIKASKLTIAIIFFLFAARSFVKALLLLDKGISADLSQLLTSAFVVLAVGLICTQRIEVWRRCRRLERDHAPIPGGAGVAVD